MDFLLTRYRINKSRYLTFAPFVVVIVFNIIFYVLGYGLSPDSVYYVSVAKNFTSFSTLFGFDSTFLDQYPPIYSLFLLPGVYIPLNVWIFILNSIFSSFLVKIFLCICKLLKIGHVKSVFIILAYTFSVFYIEIYSMVWSETIFNLIFLSVVFYLLRVVSSKEVLARDLIVLITLVWLALGIRYIGLVLIPVIFIVFLYKFRKLFLVTAYSLFACLPVAGYFTHYSAHGLGIFGTRYSSTVDFRSSLLMVPRAIGSAFLPTRFQALVLICGLIILALLGILFFASFKDLNLVILTLIIIIYLAALVYSEFRTQVDPINARLLSPIAPLLFIFFALVLQKTFNESICFSVIPGMVVLMILLLTANGAHLLFNLTRENSNSVGVIHTLNETIKSEYAPSSHPPIFSTNPWRTYVETGIQPIYYLPTTTNYYNPPDKLAKDIVRLVRVLTNDQSTFFYCYDNLSVCADYLRIRKLHWSMVSESLRDGSDTKLFLISKKPLSKK